MKEFVFGIIGGVLGSLIAVAILGLFDHLSSKLDFFEVYKISSENKEHIAKLEYILDSIESLKNNTSPELAENLCKYLNGSNVSASSEKDEERQAYFAVDSEMETYWLVKRGDGGNHWLKMSFSSDIKIHKIVINNSNIGAVSSGRVVTQEGEYKPFSAIAKGGREVIEFNDDTQTGVVKLELSGRRIGIREVEVWGWRVGSEEISSEEENFPD